MFVDDPGVAQWGNPVWFQCIYNQDWQIQTSLLPYETEHLSSVILPLTSRTIFICAFTLAESLVSVSDDSVSRLVFLAIKFNASSNVNSTKKPYPTHTYILEESGLKYRLHIMILLNTQVHFNITSVVANGKTYLDSFITNASVKRIS